MPDLRYQDTQHPYAKYQGRLHPLSAVSKAPDSFPSPFNIRPHVLAQQAAECLQSQMSVLCGSHDFNAPGEGKMIGVLVVQTPDQKTCYLAAFSGMLGNPSVA